MGFFVFAAIQAAVVLIFLPALLVDAALYAGGGYALRRFESRTVAIGLFIVGALGAWATGANRIGLDGYSGGTNLFLAAIVLWAAARGVQATFALHGRLASAEARG